MVGEFDRIKFKKLMKFNNLSQKDIVEKLFDDYRIEVVLGTVQKWTLKAKKANGDVYKPQLDTLVALADMMNCSIIDFYSDSQKKRDTIAKDEIQKNPEKYLDLIMSLLEKTDYSDDLLDKLKAAREN